MCAVHLVYQYELFSSSRFFTGQYTQLLTD